LTVTPANDTVAEPDETVIVTLSTNAAYAVGTPNAATVTILDNETPTISVAASDPNAAEAAVDPGVFTFTRLGTKSSALTVNFTMGGTATSGTDYTSLGTSISLAANGVTKTLTLTPIDDTASEAAETAILTLGTGTGYSVGTPNTASVTITDNDLPTVTIAATDGTASETSPDTGTFTVTRTGPTTNALTVNFVVSGSATSGTDFSAIGTALTIAAGSATGTLTVTPANDTVAEPDETVIVTLSTNAAYMIGTPNTATVTIADNETPLLSVAATDASAAEAGLDPGVFTFTRLAWIPTG
jgi:hypothetical protein